MIVIIVKILKIAATKFDYNGKGFYSSTLKNASEVHLIKYLTSTTGYISFNDMCGWEMAM